MYFNYHAKAKNKIKQGLLVKFEIIKNYNGIEPALVLFFSDNTKMPIREHKWQEYFALIYEFFEKK